jgi:hypothetical protein
VRAVIERLERFVGEVQDIASGQVAMVGRGGEDQVSEYRRVDSGPNSGGYAVP